MDFNDEAFRHGSMLKFVPGRQLRTCPKVPDVSGGTRNGRIGARLCRDGRAILLDRLRAAVVVVRDVGKIYVGDGNGLRFDSGQRRGFEMLVAGVVTVAP